MPRKPHPIKIEWKRLKNAHGYAYPDERRIELDTALARKPAKLIEIAAHEVAHIELPDIDETATLRLGKSIADVLLRLGFGMKDGA